MNDLLVLDTELFSMMRELKTAKKEDLKLLIEKNLAMNEIARTVIAGKALMLKAANDLWGLDIASKMPLIPTDENFINPDKKTLQQVNKNMITRGG